MTAMRNTADMTAMRNTADITAWPLTMSGVDVASTRVERNTMKERTKSGIVSSVLEVKKCFVIADLGRDTLRECTDEKSYARRFWNLHDEIGRWSEVELDNFIGKDPRRLKDYDQHSWGLERCPIASLGVRPGMRGFPPEWCAGNVKETAHYLAETIRTGQVLQYQHVIRDIKNIAKLAHVVDKFSPVIAMKDLHRERKLGLRGYRRTMWDLDDGSTRTVGLAMGGLTEIQAWLAYPCIP